MADEVQPPIVVNVPRSSDGIPRTVEGETPPGMPNVIVKAVPKVQIVATRVARVYLTAFLGMWGVITSGVASEYLTPPREFAGKMWLAAGFALAPSVIQLLGNLVEWVTALDERGYGRKP